MKLKAIVVCAVVIAACFIPGAAARAISAKRAGPKMEKKSEPTMVAGNDRMVIGDDGDVVMVTVVRQ